MDLTSTSHDSDHDLESSQSTLYGGASQEKNESVVILPTDFMKWSGPDDPEDPKNFANGKKFYILMSYALMTFIVTLASSVFSPSYSVTAKEFGVSSEVIVLGTSLNVLGFAFGPLVFGPLSELYGRRIPLLAGFFIFSIFNLPVALAQNIETLLICRFIVGFGGAAPLAIVGGVIADVVTPLGRGVAVCLVAGMTFMGSICGPVVGGFVVESSLGWRWTSWLTLIPGLVLFLTGLIFMPETYSVLLLERRAKANGQQVELRGFDLKDIANRYLLRPFAMLVSELILALITLYMALIYGILYLFLEAYPISFHGQRGWSLGVSCLPFLSLAVGTMLAAVVIIVHNNTRWARLWRTHGKVEPEERLVPMILGAILIPVGLFWFAWTSDPNITWIPQVLSGALICMGLVSVFLQGLAYIVDAYTIKANSGVAANVFVRSFFGAGFPLFAKQMYHRLGVEWATSLLALLCLVLVPVPILFFLYGKTIRRNSKYTTP